MKRGKRIRVVNVLTMAAILLVPPLVSSQSVDEIRARMSNINAQLAARGENFRLEVVEYHTAWGEVGQEVYFNNRTKQLPHDWAPGDPRRGGFMDIAWLSDQVDGTANGVTLADTQAAVDRAMATWNGVKCASIPLTKLPDFGMDWGYVQALLCGPGGFLGWFADITEAGWLPGAFFECSLGPGASDVVLGVTFTFVWIDGSGNFTDINRDKKIDVAFREIYYNNAFPWGIDTNLPIDVESVVLHENGHGVSLGHFGKLFETYANGKFHFAPLAVMNAGYTGILQVLLGSDNAAFCSMWSSWPNK